MERDLVNAICAALPGAEVSDPFGGGHDVWKVGGKIFAIVGAMDQGVSVKTPDIETAAFLIEMGRGRRAPYLHRSWVMVPWGVAQADELRDRLEGSYALIRGKLPRKVQAALAPLGD